MDLHRGAITVLATWVLAGPTEAQQGGESGLAPTSMPIEVVATPSKTMPGGIVTLHGTTGLVGESSRVSIQVTPPGSKPPVTLTAEPDAKGAFLTTFAGTKDLGAYQVTATAPDAKAQSQASFTVVAADAIPAEVAGLDEALLAGSAKALDIARQRLQALPISPARDKVGAKLDAVRQHLEQAPGQMATFRKAMTRVFEQRAMVTEPMPEWDEYLGTLTTWEPKARSQEGRLEALASSDEKAVSCTQLQWISDIVGLVSETISLAQVPMDNSRSFWTDKIPAGLGARALPAGTSSAARFLLVEQMKLAVTLLSGPQAWLTTLAGLALDATQFATNVAIAAYCVKFEGPVEGKFVGEALTSSREHWWAYTIGLTGRVVLMYPKDTPAGQPVSLRGFIEGAGQFMLRENPAVIGRLIPGLVLFHHVTYPLTPPYVAELGSGLGGVMPHSFRLPLVGVLEGDSITIRLEAPTFDFADIIEGHLIWVVIPLGVSWPEVINSPVKFQKAHPIFERVIRRHPILKIQTHGDQMVALGQFVRDTTSPDGEAHVTTTVTLKACNPGCMTFPLGPKGK